jgi:hypothetical protein
MDSSSGIKVFTIEYIAVFYYSVFSFEDVLKFTKVSRKTLRKLNLLKKMRSPQLHKFPPPAFNHYCRSSQAIITFVAPTSGRGFTFCVKMDAPTI